MRGRGTRKSGKFKRYERLTWEKCAAHNNILQGKKVCMAAGICPDFELGQGLLLLSLLHAGLFLNSAGDYNARA